VRGPALAAAALGAVACKAEPAEPAGVGAWDVTRSTLAEASGRCEPTDLPDGRKGTWCYMQPALEVGGQAAQVDLYFGGREPSSPLIELQLKVVACDSDKVDAWARTAFGTPTTGPGGATFFGNRYMNIALVRAPGSRCLVRIFPVSEQAEFERVKREAAGG
jgi:hypothetical protein